MATKLVVRSTAASIKGIEFENPTELYPLTMVRDLVTRDH